MMERIIILFFTLSLITSQIVVKSPPELVSKFPNGTINATLSLFGRIPYGHTIVGKLYYDPDNEDVDMACKPITSIKLDSRYKVDESPIVMLDRGNCTFVTKTRNVEDIGGHVALIVNNNATSKNLWMADDGTGNSLTIPALLINKPDGDVLEKYYKDNKNNKKILDSIILQINFEMEHPSNIVQYDFHLSSDTESVYKLIIELYPFHRYIYETSNLTVHYTTYRDNSYNMDDSKKNSPKDNCLGNGKYCNSPGKFGVTDGRVIVRESLKQKCIYNHAYSTNNPNIYWEYMENFYVKCLRQKEPEFTKECSDSVTSSSYKAAVDQCIYDSWIAEDKDKKDFEVSARGNTILDQDQERNLSWFIYKIPSILINGRHFYGSWTGFNVFEAICAGYMKKPEICYLDGIFEKEGTKGLSWLNVILVTLVVVAVNVILFVICKNYIRKKIMERINSSEINSKINNVVHSYMALQDNASTIGNK